MDERFLRPEELHDLKGDSSKLRTKLNWTPDYTFELLMDDMLNEERLISGVDHEQKNA